MPSNEFYFSLRLGKTLPGPGWPGFCKENCLSSKLNMKLCRPPRYGVPSSRCDSLPALAHLPKQPALSLSLDLALPRERRTRDCRRVPALDVLVESRTRLVHGRRVPVLGVVVEGITRLVHGRRVPALGVLVEDRTHVVFRERAREREREETI